MINPWFPYEMMSPDDQEIRGITGEYVDLIFKEIGYTPIFIVEPSFDKAIARVANKEADAIYTLLENPERKEQLLFSDSIITPYESIYFINKTFRPDLEGAKLEDIKEPLIFGSVVGETETEIFTKNCGNFVFINTFKEYASLMKSLDAQIIDVALLEKYNGLYEYAQYKMSNPNSTFVIGKMENILKQNLKIAFSKTEKGEVLKTLFDEKNNELKKTNILRNLFIKYVGE